MTDLDGLVAEGLVKVNVDLAPLTTYKLGGPGRWFAQPHNIEALDRLASAWRRSGSPPVLCLGRGSNLVVADKGFPGLVIKLGPGFAAVEFEGDTVVAGASVPLPMLARTAVTSGRLGLEWFVGIPGSVGGAVHQNAGCHGSETVDWLIDATVLSLQDPSSVARRSAEDLALTYRHSNLRTGDVVLQARFRTVRGRRAEGERRMREVTRWRKTNQPGGTLNAGSVFKNPAGDAAGRLIDEAGLKGTKVGGASVSDRHANFFVAGPEATAQDLWTLMQRVRGVVAERFGVDLEPEIAFVGDFE